ncbi:MAG: hypothetical protein AAF560_12465 [Acidobacteriota bacterium]
MRRQASAFGIVVLAVLATAQHVSAEKAQEYEKFDTDRQEWLVDTDGDGIVDLTEEIAGTDALDATEFPGAEGEPEAATRDNTKSAGFPTSSCRSSFRQAASRLCIDQDEQNATTYDRAQARCRSRLAHVCSYEDLFYLYYYSSLDSSYNPNGLWLGDFVGDDQVLCGNKSITFNGDPDQYNFEGACNKSNSRQYYCCHDKE